MKKCINFILLLAVCVSSLPIVPLTRAHAESYLDELSFQEDMTLTKQDSPYYVSGELVIPENITVHVDSGVKIIFQSGTIKVRGALYIQGKENESVVIEQDGGSKGFTLIGGLLNASYIDVTGGSKLIDAYSSSTVLISDFKFSDAGSPSSSGAFISVWQNSLMSLKNGSMLNINTGQGLEAFLGGAVFIDTVNMSSFGSRTFISIFSNLIQNGVKVRSVIDIASSTLDKGYGGVQVFSEAYATIRNSTFQNFENTALSVFSKGEVEIRESAIIKNTRGIETYDSYVTAEESIFENNSEYAVLHAGGSFEGKDNWWGDSSGPYSLDKNPTGIGDAFYGVGNVSPWLTEKKKTECCSNVLFIPGVQGSRIYKKNIFNKEIQLWEPGGNSDVSKLFLDQNGLAKDKTLYTRDIIDKTNISFGLFDVGVYNNFIHAMNGLDMNFSIRDWAYFPYDWRGSPNDVAVSGAVVGEKENTDTQFKSMESEVERLSKTSKTRKVTLIAHSYGGLISKRFLSYLFTRGKIGLIDKVILVAVPEEGSPSALFALLHGDTQDIGNGYILSKNTARKLALNMPSLYALLPSYNSQFVKGLSPDEKFIVPDISNVVDMYKFMFNETKRPFTLDLNENEIPIVANKVVSDSVKSEALLYKPQEDPAFKNIKFYNIIGTGINTPSTIVYKKGKCNAPLYKTILGNTSEYCGLKHDVYYSKLGDGNVPFGNPDVKWGDKYIFDMSNYNSDNSKNFSHANIISSDPVISTLMQMLLDNIGKYQLPKYISHYGGSRINLFNQVAHSVSKPTYVLSSSEDLNINMRDAAGNTAGANLDYLNELKKSAGDSSGSMYGNSNTNLQEFIPTQNTSPNSSYGSVGESAVLTSEYLPTEVHAIAGVSLQNNAQTNPVVYTDISLIKIEPETNTGTNAGAVLDDGQNIRHEDVIFEFKDIPVTENTHIEIKIDNASTSNPMNEGNSSSSIQAVLTITDIVNGEVGVKTTFSSTGGGSIVNSLNPANIAGMSSVSMVGGFVDIGYIISSIRESLVGSSLRKSFKKRYLLKLETIGKYHKSTNESTRALARRLSKDTVLSLMSIIKDLGRSRPLYYSGGMQRGEAIYLYSQFLRLGRAYGDF